MSNAVDARCHCGNITLKFIPAKPLEDLFVRRCDCKFCNLHGVHWTSDPDGQLDIFVADIDILNRYQFGHRTAEFLVCACCGVVPAVLCEINGTTYGAFNINTAEDRLVFPENAKIVSFEGETLEDRLRRRSRNWVGKVVLEFN
ncbi:MAG: hypothetical protein OQJ97_15045 [Rhodospirillales bacterium]|nr:hypothetical protein [Rhodospirillales bacterium]